MARGTFEARATVSVGGHQLSPDDWNERVLGVATELAGARVLAVEAQPTTNAVIAILAGLAAGVTVVPISPDAGPLERDHILRDSGADALWSEDHAQHLTDGASNGARTREPVPLLLYTSGTTGLAKGVPITEASIVACLDGLKEAWDWTPDDTLVHGLPLHHVHGLVLGILGPLYVGSGVVHTERPTPEAYAAARGSMYFGVPTVWGRIAAHPSSAQALAGARLLVSGSAALPRGVFDALGALTGQAPVERYGMTETLITLSARAREPRVQGTVGRPIVGVDVRIVDDDDEPVARDGSTVGALEVRGPTVFSGYLNRPEASRSSFTADGWFRTGDVATVDEAGVHRLVGRASTDLIKSGGYRIGAGEVEDALLSHPSVLEAAVVGIPDDDLGQRIVAFVVATDHDAAPLIAHVGSQLSWHKRPREIRFVDALPRNALGKVEKARLT